MGYKIIVKKEHVFWYALILSGNGQILSTSETYFSKYSCLRTWRRFAERMKIELEIIK